MYCLCPDVPIFNQFVEFFGEMELNQEFMKTKVDHANMGILRPTRLSAVSSQHLIEDSVKMMLENTELIQKIFGKDDNPGFSSVRVNSLHLCSCSECIGRKRCRKSGIKVGTPFHGIP